jgi:hypothetical protein
VGHWEKAAVNHGYPNKVAPRLSVLRPVCPVSHCVWSRALVPLMSKRRLFIEISLSYEVLLREGL